MVFAGHVAIFGAPVLSRYDPLVFFVGVNRGLGVDLFFVLSGFLITGILCDTKESPAYFRNFFARRTLRIFPLYYAVLAVVAAGQLLLPDVDSLSFITTEASIANWTYTSNFLLAFRGWNAEPLFLIPFWSLAVEEQFYLIWPAVVLGLGAKALSRVCIVAIGMALAVRLVLLASGAEVAAYVLLPARMDALLIGALIALHRRELWRMPRWMGSPGFLAFTWLLLLGALATRSSEPNGFFGNAGYGIHFTVAGLAFGTLLLALVEERHSRWLALLFRWTPLRFFGKYSYAIYIVHVAVITLLPKLIRRVSIGVTGEALEPGIFVFGLLALGVSVLLALITWRLIERPALRLRERLAFKGAPAEASASVWGNS